MAEQCPAPAVQKSIAVDFALIGHDDERLRDLEVASVTTVKQHDAHPLYVRQTVPGIGKLRRLVLWDAIHDIGRCPRVQDVVSSGRLVTGAQESAGQHSGTSGTKSSNAYRKWAFSAAAALVLRNNPAGQQYRARLEHKHGKGKALPVVAHQLARAVYDRLQRTTACEMEKFLQSERRGAGEPAASLGHNGLSLASVLGQAGRRASLHAWEHIGSVPCPCALD